MLTWDVFLSWLTQLHHDIIYVAMVTSENEFVFGKIMLQIKDELFLVKLMFF